jgi:hypothetical protein
MTISLKTTGVIDDGSNASLTAHCWVHWDQVDHAINNSYNVSALADNGVGRTTVTFATALSSAAFGVTWSPKDNNWGGSGHDGWIGSYSTTTYRMTNYSGTTGYHDSSNMSGIVFGDQ